jgi:hypothetical protein
MRPGGDGRFRTFYAYRMSIGRLAFTDQGSPRSFGTIHGDGVPHDSDYAISTATFEGISVHQAEMTAGHPFLDANKKSAYPAQGNVLSSIEHFSRTAAIDSFGLCETLCLEYFAYANPLYFFGKIPKIHIKLGTCRSPRTAAGTFSPIGDHGFVKEIVLNINHFKEPSCLSDYGYDDNRFAIWKKDLQDVMLHEMVHAYCTLVLNKPEVSYRGHGPVFAAECNRIGKELGLAEVKTAWQRSEKYAGMPTCNHWPSDLLTEETQIDQELIVDCDDDTMDTSFSDAITADSDFSDTDSYLDTLLESASKEHATTDGCRRIAYLVVQIGRRINGDDFMPLFPATEALAEEFEVPTTGEAKLE